MNDTEKAAPRGLGPWMALALVMGNLIGSGVYLLPATLAPLGFNQLIGWIVTSAAAMSMAAVFARLGARMPMPGGPYGYVQAAFGPFAGFVTAWSYWVLLWVGNGALAVAVVSALAAVFPAMGQITGLPALLAVGCVWLLTFVNIRGVRSAGDLTLVTTVLKSLPLITVIVLALALWLGGTQPIAQTPVPITGGNIAAAAGLCFWAFLGIESATVPADKVENASRVVPMATIVGTMLSGALFLGISAAFQGYMPLNQAATSPAPIAAFLAGHFGGAVGNVVAIFAAISAFGALNGFILLQGEMPWAMARGGVFPRWFAAETAAGTPARGHIVSSTLLSAVTLLNYGKGMANLFSFIASVSLAAGMLSYALTMLAALRLLPGERALIPVALFAFAFCGWATWGLGLEAIGHGAVLLVLGLPIYALVRRGSAVPGNARRDQPVVARCNAVANSAAPISADFSTNRCAVVVPVS